MSMTITEKIIARHADKASVRPGEKVWVDVDVLMTHDVCGPGTVGIFKEQFGPDAKVWNRDRVVVIPDHFIFTADAKAQRNIDILREFVAEQDLPHYYDPDFIPAGGCKGIPPAYDDPRTTPYAGVCHAALHEKGHVRPGELLIGTDSHTCTAGALGMFASGMGNTDAAFILGTGKTWLMVPETLKFVFHGTMPPYLMAKDLILHVIGEIGFDRATYRAMEFAGEALMSLNIDERCTLPNMAIEAGGKNGIIATDELTCEYVRQRTDKPFETVASDPDADVALLMEFQTDQLEPVVACPHAPDNRRPARELGDVRVDRCYIGSCTGGQITDMQAAAEVLKDREVKIETFVVPGSTEIDAQMDTVTVGDRSVRQVLQDAGCRIGPSSCMACLGGPRDTFGRANEPINVVSATNRNFPGRMGHKEAGVFLASPLTVAATAAAGEIVDPRDWIDLDKPVGLR
ncbi:MAG: 3-isopropylmalate dehydratase large subunit [Planctomycetes bacterium]|jgi:3-isopropylmalate/(R)-2-methylmalate dehydratase large subunit|nr:3-isopropylmalate dehydratase large subunit [Planctomycetota bacterium]